MRLKIKGLQSTPTVGEVCSPHFPKPAKSLARVPSLRVRLVILLGSLSVPRSVESFVEYSFPTSAFTYPSYTRLVLWRMNANFRHAALFLNTGTN